MDPDESDIEREAQRSIAAAALAAWVERQAGPPVVPRAPPAVVPGAHFHPVPEVFLALAGGSRFTCAEGSVEIRPGQVLIVPAGVGHREEPRRGSRNLVVKFLAGHCQFHCSREGTTPLPDAVATDLEQFCNRCLDDAVVASQAGEMARSQCLVTAWAEQTRWLLAGPVPRHALGDLLERALVHIREDLAGCSPASVAYRCGVTSDHLSRCFRQRTGQGLHSAITATRVQVAERLLGSSEQPVATIARTCGFSDPDYFARVFKRATGSAPRVWRRQRRG